MKDHLVQTVIATKLLVAVLENASCGECESWRMRVRVIKVTVSRAVSIVARTGYVQVDQRKCQENL